MDKAVILKLLRSIFLVCLVSLTASYFLSFTGFNFVASTLFFILLQFIFFYFYGEFINRKRIKLFLETEAEIARERSKQYTTVTCPCDRKITSDIPININGNNTYKCQGCEKMISVYVETKTALSTQPVLTNPLDEPILIEELEKVINTKNDNK